MENYLENLEEARRHFRTAERMSYITISVLKDNRLLIKILSEMADSVTYLIKAILQYEHAKNKVWVYHSPELNLDLFKEKIAQKYIEKRDIQNLIEIIEINSQHKKAASEFVRKESFVIFLGSTYKAINLEKIKELLSSLRKIFSNVILS